MCLPQVNVCSDSFLVLDGFSSVSVAVLYGHYGVQCRRHGTAKIKALPDHGFQFKERRIKYCLRAFLQ